MKQNSAYRSHHSPKSERKEQASSTQHGHRECGPHARVLLQRHKRIDGSSKNEKREGEDGTKHSKQGKIFRRPSRLPKAMEESSNETSPHPQLQSIHCNNLMVILSAADVLPNEPSCIYNCNPSTAHHGQMQK